MELGINKGISYAAGVDGETAGAVGVGAVGAAGVDGEHAEEGHHSPRQLQRLSARAPMVMQYNIMIVHLKVTTNAVAAMAVSTYQATHAWQMCARAAMALHYPVQIALSTTVTCAVRATLVST